MDLPEKHGFLKTVLNTSQVLSHFLEQIR